jgi:hypothetical protein
VGDLSQSGLVGQVVTPVADTVDSVVAQVPVVSGLLGDDPVSSITTPLAGTVDHMVSGAVGAVAGVVPSADEQPGTGAVKPPSSGVDAPGAGSDAPCIVPGTGAAFGAATHHTFARAATSDTREQSAPAAAGTASTLGASSGGHDPTAPSPGDPGAPPPANGFGGSSAPAGGAGASGAAADSGYTSVFPPVAAGSSSQSGGDALPSSPTGDHDVSPD